MGIEIDHDANIQNELAIQENRREKINSTLRKETEDEMRNDSYFVRVLKQDKEENRLRPVKTNNRPNVNVITNSQPYTLNELMNIETKELGHKVRRVPIEKVDKYIEKRNKLKDSDYNSRFDVIYQEALVYGTQSGLHYRGSQLKNFIDKYESEWETFNFTPLMLAKGKVVPPVIVESKQNLQSSDRYTLRGTDRSYRILDQVKVVNNPINWRQYLIINIPKPTVPDEEFLPLNPEEDHFWKLGMSQGWEVGVSQANSVYLENIRKLQRDYVGMVTFHIMLKRGMITNPVTSTTTLGVTGEIDETMNVNETIFKIDRNATFNLDSESWKALNELPSVFE